MPRVPRSSPRRGGGAARHCRGRANRGRRRARAHKRRGPRPRCALLSAPRSAPFHQIGRASCRERVCQYVSISVVAVSLKKKTTETQKNKRTKQKTKKTTDKK